jgi:hypothetical protein
MTQPFQSGMAGEGRTPSPASRALFANPRGTIRLVRVETYARVSSCGPCELLPGINAGGTIRRPMLDSPTAQDISWKLSIVLRMFLLCLLIFRRNVRSFPFFTAYLAINLAKALLASYAYRAWGFSSHTAFWIVWPAEGVVIAARALAVGELCHLLLGRYRGIWSLAWRVLLTCAGLVLLYSWIVSAHAFDYAIFSAGRGLELSIAAVIVVLFIFLRHYQVVSEPSLRSLAIGFCLYACIAVLNFTVLQSWFETYWPIWNLLSVFAYLPCLSIWIWAFRKSIPVFNPVLLPSAVYQQISPEINARLRVLNERLCRFWKIQEPRP